MVCIFSYTKGILSYTKVEYSVYRDTILFLMAKAMASARLETCSLENTADVGFHSGDADDQGLGDLLVALALHNQVQHFHLSFSQVRVNCPSCQKK